MFLVQKHICISIWHTLVKTCNPKVQQRDMKNQRENELRGSTGSAEVADNVRSCEGQEKNRKVESRTSVIHKKMKAGTCTSTWCPGRGFCSIKGFLRKDAEIPCHTWHIMTKLKNSCTVYLSCTPKHR